MLSASRILKEIYNRAETAEYIGESLSQLDHALQSAALAEHGQDEELVLAALLHDVGHICDTEAPSMGDVGVLEHEFLGAEFLTGLGFSKRVVELVAGHVDAKRYLVATQPLYEEKMSAASRTTLSYQGGKMNPEEVAKFEGKAHFRDVLKLRAWDEAAKGDVSVPDFSNYQFMIDDHVANQKLTEEEVDQFHQQGFLHLKDRFSSLFLERLRDTVGSLESLPETPQKWMKYFETGSNGERLLCRIENFLDYQSTLSSLVNGPLMTGWVSQLMGQEAVLFKEKINFKLPGAEGFKPHQDAPAFTTFGHSYHITLMLSFDASTARNGCLELVPGRWRKDILQMRADKTLSDDVSESLSWQTVPTEPGDILLFGSYLPHRSGANGSTSSRRALYATYNHAVEGDVRDQYFAEKRRVFPPDIERVEGHDYGDSGVFNVGNPVSSGGSNSSA